MHFRVVVLASAALHASLMMALRDSPGDFLEDAPGEIDPATRSYLREMHAASSERESTTFTAIGSRVAHPAAFLAKNEPTVVRPAANDPASHATVETSLAWICHQQGLRSNPNLRGTITVSFIIDRTGAVEHASLTGSLPYDTLVSACVLGAFRTLSFPEPDTGKVLVDYSIAFDGKP